MATPLEPLESREALEAILSIPNGESFFNIYRDLMGMPSAKYVGHKGDSQFRILYEKRPGCDDDLGDEIFSVLDTYDVQYKVTFPDDTFEEFTEEEKERIKYMQKQISDIIL